MYTLQIKAINTIEDKFFDDESSSEDKSETRKIVSDLQSSLNMSFVTTTKRYKDKDLYVIERLKTGFKSIEDAEKYMLAFVNSNHPVREKIRQWNQEHNILSEIKILDKHRNVVKVITDCTINLCVRFGGKCDEDNGCSTVTFAKQYAKNKKPFPVKIVTS